MSKSLTLAATAVFILTLAPAAQEEPRRTARSIPQQLEEPQHADVEIVGHVLEPQRLDPTPERIARLRVPAGFEINVFADNLINPRMLAVADDGTVYVTRREVGDVVMLKDTDNDGRADTRRPVANRPGFHGIAIDGDTVYLATVSEVYKAQRRADGTLGSLEQIINDLPVGGQHPNRTLVVGPDGKLYISVGSTCNACGETSPENATILRAETDGSYRTIFASGLRNTIGFAFHPESDELFGMDHGIDWLGDNEQSEELNHIVQDHHYGWPYVYADGQFNPQDQPPAGITMEEWAARSTDPVGLYTPHAAPMQLAFYTGDQFPAEFKGDAFIAMRGSWNRRPPSGYEIVRIRFDNGQPAGFEPIVQGFLLRSRQGEWGHFGRLAGLAQVADGSLLFSDDTNGVIYRLSYTGAEGRATRGVGAPTNLAGAKIGVAAATVVEASKTQTPNDLAMQILARDAGTIDVTSSAFNDGESVPDEHAADGQNVSPPLNWAEGPQGTRSYVLMMEDPDVSQDPPYVHWIVYNVPANVTHLAEGVPGTPKLVQPQGVKQGLNEHGSIGYFGMKPPVGDPPHHYHFQIFALDTELDLPHSATRAEVLRAMEGHVLAAGEVVGTYQRGNTD